MTKSSLTTGRDSCLDALYRTIVRRVADASDDSYTAQLHKQGIETIARKLGEEAIETMVEALKQDKTRLIEESADLLYHLLVLWSASGVSPQEVWEVLEDRHRRKSRQKSPQTPDPSET